VVCGIVRWIVVLCSMSLVACTSLRVVGPAEGQRPLSALAPDEYVIVTKTDEHRVRLRVSAVSDEFLDGVDESSVQPLHLPIKDIAMVERREFSVVKTVLLMLAISVVAYTLRELASAPNDILDSSAAAGGR
jgi:hypothetical protein